MTINVKDIELLFPTKIQFSTDDKFDEYKVPLVKWMNDYSFKNPTVTRSNFGGYQSPDNFYYEESFAPFLNRLSEWIVTSQKAYVKGTILEDVPLKLGNMWFNFNHQYCYNVMHTHPGCLIAGVIWLRMPTDIDVPPLVFQDPMSHLTSELDEGVSDARYNPVDGEMCIFPAHIPHRVDINESTMTRVSLSFNIGYA